MTLAGKLACLGLILIACIAAHMTRLGVVPTSQHDGFVLTDRWTGRVYACWIHLGTCDLIYPIDATNTIDLRAGFDLRSGAIPTKPPPSR
jgi:hypothetical protein